MRIRRVEIVLFVLAWVSYAYFHQGGGWNQNGRFALTRALVETRQPWIDDFLIYAPAGPIVTPQLRRIPVSNGCVTDAGKSFALGWVDAHGARTPLAPDAPPDFELLRVDGAAASGDLAFARGHVHPNKAPGTSLAAAPGYSIVLGLERLFGIDPDAAWILNVNEWLTGVFSVGLVAALGVVMFYRAALWLSAGRGGGALFATVAFAFGTLYFPYATMLYEHDLVAVALLGAFLLSFNAPSLPRLFGAGVCAGAAIVASYLSVVAAAILGVYVFWRSRKPRAVLAFAAGAIPPLAILGAYNLACFGRLLTTNYAWENPLFKEAGSGLIELFAEPRWEVLITLLLSQTRGLFAGTPVLVLGVIGLVMMLRQPRVRAEGLLFTAMIAYVLVFNVTFKAWHGGWACGPRYLIPALPFLALPIAFIAPRAAWVRHGILAISIAAMALATSVDAQPPLTRTTWWTTSPIWDIDLPQFLHGRPGSVATANWKPTILARYLEPVSTNPQGAYEAMPKRFFALDSGPTRWSSFNAGEFLFPGSRLSLIPWLLMASILAVILRRELRR